jgi:protein-S-isoprenylcysteine O-methyltransferase Ste14
MTLNQHYTYTVTKTENHELIETGLYRYIRHPGYLGFLMVFLGISVALSNWLSIVLMMAPLMVGIMNRIRIEEIFLIEQMGDKYLTYQKQTKKLIPKIY